MDIAASELVQGWFRVSEPEPGVFAIDEPLHDERVCSHLILGSDRALLVDTGMGMADLKAVVRSLTDLPVTVLISHAHFDHVGSTADFAGDSDILVHPLEADRLRRGVDNAYVRRFLAPEHLFGALPAGIDPETFAIPGAEPTGTVEDGDVIDLGGRSLEIIHCPGHSPGLLALLDRGNGLLFTTDVIYGGRLYAHLPGVDLPAYRETVHRLAALQPAVRALYPSHTGESGKRPLPPRMLGDVASAFEGIAAGREPEEIDGEVGRHLFDGFSVLMRVEGAA